jgi:hypothetical protein
MAMPTGHRVAAPMRCLSGGRPRGRAGDVGDSREVIPVDSMPYPQDKAGQEHPEAGW